MFVCLYLHSYVKVLASLSYTGHGRRIESVSEYACVSLHVYTCIYMQALASLSYTGRVRQTVTRIRARADCTVTYCLCTAA
jgi:hypothetical protein